MPLFAFRAVSDEGIAVTGVEEAPSSIEAARQIGERRLLPVEIVERRAGKSILDRIGVRRRIPAAQLTRLFGHLQDLLESGIPLTSALTLIADQMESRRLMTVLSDIALRVENGKTFSEAITPYKHLFPPVFPSLIRAGEESGQLPTVLGRLVEYVEREAETKRKVVEAMIYPTIVVLIGTAVTTLMLVFMVPRFVGILVNMGVSLPAPTRILIALSDGIRRFGPYAAIGAVAAAASLPRLLRQRTFRFPVDGLVLRAPVVGAVIRKASIARFAKTMGTLLGSGVPILPALDLVGPTYGNLVLEAANRRLLRAIEGGENLATSIRRDGSFPPMVVEMVAVGESTGALDRMLKKIGEIYDKEVERATRRMTLILEPALIVVLGVVVGFVALALILPMLKAVATLGRG